MVVWEVECTLRGCQYCQSLIGWSAVVPVADATSSHQNITYSYFTGHIFVALLLCTISSYRDRWPCYNDGNLSDQYVFSARKRKTCVFLSQRLLRYLQSSNFHTSIHPSIRPGCARRAHAHVQGSAKRCANFVKQQPGRARQNS